MSDGDVLPTIVGMAASAAVWIAFSVKAVRLQRELSAAHLFIDYLQLPIAKESTLGQQAASAAASLGEPKFRETPVWLWALLSVNVAATIVSIILFAMTTDSSLMGQRLFAMVATLTLNAALALVTIRVAEYRRGMLWQRVIAQHAIASAYRVALAEQINWGGGGWGRAAFEIIVGPALKKVSTNRRNHQRKANRRAQRERAKNRAQPGIDERGASDDQ